MRQTGSVAMEIAILPTRIVSASLRIILFFFTVGGRWTSRSSPWSVAAVLSYPIMKWCTDATGWERSPPLSPDFSFQNTRSCCRIVTSAEDLEGYLNDLYMVWDDGAHAWISDPGRCSSPAQKPGKRSELFLWNCLIRQSWPEEPDRLNLFFLIITGFSGINQT